MKSNQTSGLLFALLGFSLLALGDAVVKSMALQWPGTAIAALRYTFGAIALGIMLASREGRAGFTMPKPWLQLGRAASVSFAAVCFFSSLLFLPLAVAISLTFVSPMFAALLSAVFLKEHPPRGALTASLMAFVGVILVLRPNLAEAGLAAFLPLGGAVGMAALMIFNRLSAGSASVLAMQFLISVLAAPILILIAWAGHQAGIPQMAVQWPATLVILKCMLVAITATSSHTLLYLATTRASAASVAPMTYVQLLVAVALGWAVFGDRPDFQTMIGATIIIASGLYLWRMQRG